MIQVKMKDGTVFLADTATWAITPKGSEKVYSFDDIALVAILDPIYHVVRGTFSDGVHRPMPVRGLLFTDASDAQFEVPLPVPVAQEMGRMLAESRIEVVKTMPSSIVHPFRLDD